MSKRNETEQLENRLISLGGKIRQQFLYEGVLRFIGFFLLGLVAFYLIDYLTRVPFIIRLLVLLSGLSYGVYWFQKKFISKYKKQLNTEQVSLLVEKANPDLKSRMISTLQFEENGVNIGTSKQLVDGLIKQTFDMIRDVSWQKAIDTSWVKPTLKMLSIGFVLVVVSALVSSEHFIVYLQRFVSSSAQYPTKTKIVDVSFKNVAKGDVYRIPEGEKIEIEVSADGELPPVGKISIYANSGSESDFDLIQDPNNAKLYKVSLDPILEKIELEIVLGDCEWGPVTVDIIPRPTITSIQAQVSSPAYMGLSKEKLDTGNIQTFENSKVELKITTDKKCKSVEVKIVQPENAPTFVFKRVSDFVWTSEIDVQDSFKYTFLLIDEGDLNSMNIPVYTVSVKKDMPPVVSILKPGSSIEAAPVSKVPFHIVVKDDFKVQTIRMLYSVYGRNEQGNEVTLVEESELFAINEINLKSKELTGAWDLNQIKSNPGNTVKIVVQALDNREPKPNEGISYEIKFNVLSVEEYNTRLLEAFKGISVKSGALKDDFKKSEIEVDRLNK